MTRKRHKKKQPKTPALAPLNRAGKVSPTAQEVANRIASGGVDYLMQNLIHIMHDSHQLAEEPEFINLYLDGEKTVQVTEHWLKKYDKHLAAAEKKGPDEYHQVFDEMRMEVVAELATPAFRKDVDERLQALLDRLMAANDIEKLEMVMLLKPLLGMKEIPWGLCGLILSIYTRTMQRTMQEYEEEKEVFEELLEAIKSEEGDIADLAKLLDAPEKLEQLGQKVLAKPDLRERAENQIWNMVKTFEKELFDGKVVLNLFTQEELYLPFQRLQAELEGKIDIASQGDEETAGKIFNVIRQTIVEIMTPERLQRFRSDVQSTAKTWWRERHKWAAALQAELDWLNREAREENLFIMAAFWGQVRQLVEDQKSSKKPKRRGNRPPGSAPEAAV